MTDGEGFQNDTIITICSDQSICCGYQNSACCRAGRGVWISDGKVLSTSPAPPTPTKTTDSTSSSTGSGLSPTSSRPVDVNVVDAKSLRRGEKISLAVGLVV